MRVLKIVLGGILVSLVTCVLTTIALQRFTPNGSTDQGFGIVLVAMLFGFGLGMFVSRLYLRKTQFRAKT